MRLMLLRPQGPLEHFFGRALDRVGGEVLVNEKTKVRDLRDLRPDLVVATAEIWRNRRECVVEANQLGIPTLYVMDGILDWRHTFENDRFWPGQAFLHPLESRKIAVPGRSAGRILASWGYAARVERVGLPRVDRALQGFTRRSVPRRTLLVVTPNAWWLNEEHRRAVERAMSDLVRSGASLADAEIRWRVQPELAESIGVASRWDRPLYDELAEVHAVVGPPTTVLLEAMALDLPVACVDYEQKPQLTRFAWTIAHEGAVVPTLQEVLAPDPRRMEFQRHLLDDQLEHDGGAEDRLVRLMDALMEEGARARAEGRPPALDRPVLDAVSAMAPSEPVARTRSILGRLRRRARGRPGGSGA
jgi:hypothetical protein